MTHANPDDRGPSNNFLGDWKDATEDAADSTCKELVATLEELSKLPRWHWARKGLIELLKCVFVELYSADVAPRNASVHLGVYQLAGPLVEKALSEVPRSQAKTKRQEKPLRLVLARTAI